MNRPARTRRLLPRLVLLCAAAGCTGGSAGAGAIHGEVRYSGPARGRGRALAIAVYRTFPPSGPPTAIQLTEEYSMPFHYRFDGLAPGRYHVGALIDVDRGDTRFAGMLNRELDPHGYAEGGAPIVVAEGHGAAAADIELVDPW